MGLLSWGLRPKLERAEARILGSCEASVRWRGTLALLAWILHGSVPSVETGSPGLRLANSSSPRLTTLLFFSRLLPCCGSVRGAKGQKGQGEEKKACISPLHSKGFSQGFAGLARFVFSVFVFLLHRAPSSTRRTSILIPLLRNTTEYTIHNYVCICMWITPCSRSRCDARFLRARKPRGSRRP